MKWQTMRDLDMDIKVSVRAGKREKIMKNVKVYKLNFDKTWSLAKEFDEKVTCVAIADGNYAVVLAEEDYFGKLVYLYDMNQYKIEILPQEN